MRTLMLIMSRGGGVSAEKFKPTSQRLILPRTEYNLADRSWPKWVLRLAAAGPAKVPVRAISVAARTRSNSGRRDRNLSAGRARVD